MRPYTPMTSTISPLEGAALHLQPEQIISHHRPPSKQIKQGDASAAKKVGAADFDYGVILGAGSFGNVFHVRLHGSQHEYAMKVMQKSFIRKEQKVRFNIYGFSFVLTSMLHLPEYCNMASDSLC